MSTRITKHVALSMALPIILTIVAFISGVRYVLGVALASLIFLGLALYLDRPPVITFEVSADRGEVRVSDTVKITVRVSVKDGAGFLYVNMFPGQGSRAGETVELAGGRNSRMAFKGWREILREYTYNVRFLSRGKYEIGEISYQYLGIFGRSRRMETVDMKRTVSVYPRERPVSFHFAIIRSIVDLPESISARMGPVSTEFRDIREYRPGDPYRFINWNATSRRQKIMINEYEMEGMKNAVFVFDTGPWMRMGTAEENPMEYGVIFMLSLSRLLLREGFNVGLWSVPSRVQVMPSSGSAHLYRLISGSLLLQVKEGDYVQQSSFLRILHEVKPHIIYITNLTEEALPKAADFLCRNGRCLPSRSTVLLDVQPFSLISRHSLSSAGINVDCVSWMQNRAGTYSRLPKRIRVVEWDPLCAGPGTAMVRVAEQMRLGAAISA